MLRSLRFEPGDELLTNDHEYNATLNAMRAVAARDGATVVVARIPFPIAGPDEALRCDPRRGDRHGRVSSLVSHVTSPTAIVLPVARARRASSTARGIDTLVDAAHAPGMVPVDVDALGAAYWTATATNGCAARRATAVLWVREDRRDRIHPLVVSHGANAVLGGRSRFRHEFDWVGTADPTGFLTLPAAIDWMRDVAAPDGGGWPAVMAANHALAIAGRDVVARRSASRRRHPIRCSGRWPRSRCRASPRMRPMRFHDALETEDRIQVPVTVWPVPAAPRRIRRARRSSSASPRSATTSSPTTSGWRPRSGGVSVAPE